MFNAEQILKTTFGYDSFRFNQEEIIASILNRRDTFVLMPTGGGKSLCYQIPGLMLSGLTVVVSPLIALMKDQVDALRLNGITAEYLNSSLDYIEQQYILDRLRQNELKFLYIAPEKLLGKDQSFLSFLKSHPISLFAIDEAHCISSWGHDFRPEYRQLGVLKKHFPRTPILALTATADAITRKDIVQKLALEEPQIFISSFNRPNISYTVVPKKNYYSELKNYLNKHQDDSGIVYVFSRRAAEDLSSDLNKDGFLSAPYHAGLSQEARTKHQEMFVKDEIKIIVATIAFGMGINKSNVRFVVHVDLPKNIESYYQETGRAGRDGLKSEALLFFGAGDVVKIKRFAAIEGNPEQTQIMLKKLSELVEMCESFNCRRKKILNYFGEEAPENCGNCDVCLTEFEKFDGTLIAQKALSGVARLENQYGMNYLINILRGSKSEKIKPYHQSLKTYGSGADLSSEKWADYIKQLISQGFLRQSGAEYPVLQLTQKSIPVLNGQEKVFFQKLSSKKELSQAEEIIQNDLFLELKAVRSKLAQEENVPAYIVLSDASLVEMATYFPQNEIELRQISGFGDTKVARYAAYFLPIIIRYCAGKNLSSRMSVKKPKKERAPKDEKTTQTKRETLLLFKKGNTIAEIAECRHLSAATIENHLAHFVYTGEIEIGELVSIDKIEQIERAAARYGNSALTPLKNALGESVSYGEIRAVVSYLKKMESKTF